MGEGGGSDPMFEMIRAYEMHVAECVGLTSNSYMPCLGVTIVGDCVR